MSAFCIDGDLLGTHNNFLCDEGRFSWTATVPDGAYHLSGRIKPMHDRCMDTLLKLNGIELDVSPPERFSNAMQLVLSGSTDPVPWKRVMPEAAHRDFMKRLVSGATEAMAKADRAYYEGTWVPGNEVLRSLRPARVNKHELGALVAKTIHNTHVVETFWPGEDGFTSPIVYDRFGALTGRLTVKSGPSILTLKKEHRGIIRSVHGKEGRILYVDFSSLEPRVLLYEAGRRCEERDMYAAIGKELGYERSAIKGAVITELYGGSKHTLGKQLGIEGKELNVFVKKIEAYFNKSELLERVKKQFIETGHVVNRYGRRVKIDEPLDNVFINYYAQSSAVDVALLGFSQLVEHLREKAPRTRPLFLITDALVLDVHDDEVQLVEEIEALKVPGYVQSFPVKVEHITPV